MDGSPTNRILRLRARRDLQVEWQTFQGRDSVVIKDPLTLRYFRFEPEEYSILQWLDGCTSAAEIKARFEQRYPPQRLSLAELQQFVGMMHRNGLLLADAPGQGEALFRRHEANQRREHRQRWLSLLAIRFRGFDPGALLGTLERYGGWMFSRLAGLVAGLLILSAAGLLFTNFETFSQKLPTFREFFAGSNWLPLALVLGVTKVLHELGHGLACRRFGGECHEMGFMLLIFSPCLYCNVSDAWMLPDKWQRMFVSAAGMYVELVLASLATFVWWFSEPGLVQQLALNVMFVCSVTTLLFNANPLMRYDGYYILSDWLEVPNLRQKAQALLQGLATQWLFGATVRRDPFLPARRRWLYMIYAVAAIAYRWVITFSIFWFLYKVLEPYGFQIIGQMLALGTLASAVVFPLWSLKKYFSVPGRWGAVKHARLGVASGIVGALVLGIVVIPIPHYVNCPCYFQAQGTTSVYVETPGHLRAIHVQTGARVDRGAPLVQLVNAEKNVELTSLAGEARIARQYFDNVNAAAASFEKYARELLPADAQRNAAASRLELMQGDLQRLTIRTPSAGTFVAAPPRKQPTDQDDELPTWQRTPTDPQNLGAYLETQTLIGQVIPDESEMEAILVIDQTDIEFIQADQRVKIWSRQLPGACFESHIAQVSPEKMKVAPEQLSIRAGGTLQTTPNQEGMETPVSSTYQVSVPLPALQVPLLSGGTGMAKVQVGTQTVGQKIWRLFCQTFRFEL